MARGRESFKVIAFILFLHVAATVAETNKPIQKKSSVCKRKTGSYEGKPCQSLSINGSNTASVCVCTPYYCDEVIRDEPEPNTFVVYTSTEDGQRLNKKTFWMQKYVHPSGGPCKSDLICNPILDLDPSTLYQTVEGFGGAVTDSAAMNWDRIESYQLRKHLIDSYFSPRGIGYNMIRLPIGGTDFSTHPYTLDDGHPGDKDLKHFALAREDTRYKIPMIKECFKAANTDVHIVGSTWSPPTWMKDSDNNIKEGYLKKEYMQTYADYHLKFLEKYSEAGVPVWAITTTNEPITSQLYGMINGLGWKIKPYGEWISKNLGPTIRGSKFNDTKILAGDDQRYTIGPLLDDMLGSSPDALKYIDGVALHYYSDSYTPIEMVAEATKKYPDLFVINTEGCVGFKPHKKHVKLGSWERADTYARDIIEDLNGNFVGWIDWNMCLDEKGGPSWASNFVDSPIIVSADGLKIYKQPIFYALGHFSKFIPRGSRRVKTTDLCHQSVDNVSFKTPRNTIVTVLRNKGEPKTVNVKLCDRVASVLMEKNSLKTIEFLHAEC